MRNKWLPILFLVVPLLGAGKGHKYGQGKKTGGYTLTLVGDYTGTGDVSVTDNNITLTLNLTMPGGAKASVTFNDLKLINDRFAGHTALSGHTIRVSGRVDLPSATDEDETAEQATTARVSAMIMDPTGKGARLVGVQNVESRGGQGDDKEKKDKDKDKDHHGQNHD